MLVYADTVEGSLDDILGDRIVEGISMAYVHRGLRMNANEVRSGQNSFQYVHDIRRQRGPRQRGRGDRVPEPSHTQAGRIEVVGTDNAGQTNTSTPFSTGSKNQFENA